MFESCRPDLKNPVFRESDGSLGTSRQCFELVTGTVSVLFPRASHRWRCHLPLLGRYASMTKRFIAPSSLGCGFVMH